MYYYYSKSVSMMENLDDSYTNTTYRRAILGT